MWDWVFLPSMLLLFTSSRSTPSSTAHFCAWLFFGCIIQYLYSLASGLFWSMGDAGRGVEGEKRKGSGYFCTGITVLCFATALAVSVSTILSGNSSFTVEPLTKLWEHYSLFFRPRGSCDFLLFSPWVFYIPFFGPFNQLFSVKSFR